VVSTNGGLANVLVYIKSGLGNAKFGPPANLVTIDFANCAFNPMLNVAMVNQRIIFRNLDSIGHNMHMTPSKIQERGFNLGVQPKAISRTVNFSLPENFVRVKCDVHPWETAYIAVVSNPFFAMTDKDGNFTITNAPPGDYILEAVHRKTHPNGEGVAQTISVREGDITHADFTIELPAGQRQLSQGR